jgi:hypothetical protein
MWWIRSEHQYTVRRMTWLAPVTCVLDDVACTGTQRVCPLLGGFLPLHPVLLLVAPLLPSRKVGRVTGQHYAGT